jgi:hypothetical protein
MSPMPKRKRETPLESGVKDKIKKLLEQHDWFWWNVPMNAYAAAGISDIHAVKTGMFMVIEAKRSDKHHPTVAQKGFLATIASHDHFAFVVDGDNLHCLEQFLGALDRATAAQRKSQQPTPEDGAMMLDCIRAMTRKY